MSAILAFFSTIMGKALLASLGVTAMGMLHETAPYKGLRAAWGRLAYRGAALLSALGKTKLGALWQPVENFILDFGVFGVEQAAAGLRSDNADKLEDQIKRLEDVGSVTRVPALKDKLELLRAVSDPALDQANAAAAYRLNQLGKASINQNLED